jgi:hypothetical protein
VTVIVAAGVLTTFPIVAVMVTLPPVVMPGTSVTVPADTVARLVLLEVQFATSVTGKGPLHVVAVAVMEIVGLLPFTDPFVGFNAIDWTHPTVTVTVCVPVMVGF